MGRAADWLHPCGRLLGVWRYPLLLSPGNDDLVPNPPSQFPTQHPDARPSSTTPPQATLPFLSSQGTKDRIAAKVKAGKFVYKHQDKVTDENDDLVTRLLTVDPLKRYTCKEALNHPWTTGKMMKEMERSVFDMMKDDDGEEEDEEEAPAEEAAA